MTTAPPSLLDHFMPRWEVASAHGITVRADAAATFAAVKQVDLSRSRSVRFLFRLRGLPTSRLTLERLTHAGFVLLGERPEREIVLGIAGRFWTPTGHLLRLTPETFADTSEPGTAKAAWSIRAEPAGAGETRLLTSTRVLTADARARRRFRLYWLLVGPFSGLTRRATLALIRRDAETRVPR